MTGLLFFFSTSEIERAVLTSATKTAYIHQMQNDMSHNERTYMSSLQPLSNKLNALRTNQTKQAHHTDTRPHPIKPTPDSESSRGALFHVPAHGPWTDRAKKKQRQRNKVLPRNKRLREAKTSSYLPCPLVSSAWRSVEE